MIDSPDVRGLPKICEEGRLNVEPASENTYMAKQGGRERGKREREKNYFSKMQEENNFSLSLLFLTLEPSLVLRER